MKDHVVVITIATQLQKQFRRRRTFATPQMYVEGTVRRFQYDASRGGGFRSVHVAHLFVIRGFAAGKSGMRERERERGARVGGGAA